jgi:hypothetical protein
MSEQNVETIRRGFDHFTATGDFLDAAVQPSVDEALEAAGLRE